MTERAVVVTLASTGALALLSMSGLVFVVVLATSLVWCLIVWTVFIR
jgi:hypothetical protein